MQKEKFGKISCVWGNWIEMNDKSIKKTKDKYLWKLIHILHKRKQIIWCIFKKKKIYAYKKYSEREKIYKCERDGWCDDGEKTPILVIQTKILL